MSDITIRACAILQKVSAICAEDTRHTRLLLQYHGIDRPMVSLHTHNEVAMVPKLLERLQQGDSLALVSDAGTPVVSDPGFCLIRAARAQGVPVSPIPGASALIAGLCVSGLPSDRFVFEGFLPSKPVARQRRLQDLATETRTLIFYESPHRIEETLLQMATLFGGQRSAVLARELTKRFETILDGPLESLYQRLQNNSEQRKGEFVLLVHGAVQDTQADALLGLRAYKLLAHHLPPSLAARIASELSGVPRKQIYAAGLAHTDQSVE